MRDIVATIQPDQDDIVALGRRARPSACRARPVPGRRRSACTGWPTCCTPTRSGSAAAACWSSGRTRPSSPTSSNVLPALGELDVAQLSVADLTVRGASAWHRLRAGGPGQGRRPDGAGAQQRAVGAAGRAGRADHAGARIAPVAGARPSEIAELAAELRDQGSAVRDRPRHARAPDRARDPDPDGGRGRDLRRPDARVRRRSRQVQAAVAQVWPKADPVRHGLPAAVRS